MAPTQRQIIEVRKAMAATAGVRSVVGTDITPSASDLTADPMDVDDEVAAIPDFGLGPSAVCS